MSLTIRPVDPWDDDAIDRLQDLYVEAARAEVPDARVFSRADSAGFLRSSGRGVRCDAFAAYEGDVMVGQAWTVASLTDNLHQANLWAWVPPRFGRRGLGSALVRHAEQHVLALGRTTAVSQTWIGPDGQSGYRAFAERLGYTLANTMVERRQTLPVSEETLAALEAHAGERASAYALRMVVGPIPTELAEGYCDLDNLLLVEMPSGNLAMEAGRRTPEQLAEEDAELLEAGRTRVTVLALDPAGSPVAFTSATTQARDSVDRGVDQSGTLVRPEHRGHRLGLAVKCAVTRAIQERFPDRAFVRTQNAETNAAMVAVNRALGFELHSVEGEFQRQLAS